ncbi:MAG TPA: hypothetical protein VGH37_03360 [Candidatus Acidoferrum sp.]
MLDRLHRLQLQRPLPSLRSHRLQDLQRQQYPLLLLHLRSRLRKHLVSLALQGSNRVHAPLRRANRLLDPDPEHQFLISLEHVLHKELVRNNLAHRQVRGQQRRGNHYARVSLHRQCVRLCQLEWVIADRCQEQLPVANNGKVDRDLVSQCGRKAKAVKVAIVRTLSVRLGLVGPAVVGKVAQVVRVEVLAKGLVQYRWVLGLVRARPGGRRCFRHFQKKCLRRPSQANPCTPASRRNGNGPQQINAKLKGSASFTQLGNGRGRVDVVWLFRLLHQNHARLAILH